jgi:histidinol-phosphate aminotransferase
MNVYWSNILKQLEPYVPGEQPQGNRLAKLNTNENPYPPSPKVIEAIRKAANDDLRLYPDPNCEELRKTIADYYDIDIKHIFIGNGSDEILAFCYAAFFNPNEHILFPDITYSFYPVYSKLFSIPYREVRLNDDFSIPITDFMVENHGIILPNPNAPTGRFLEIKELFSIIRFNCDLNKVVIIDEAYIDFGGNSLIKFIDEFPNLLIVQTLSKSRSLAGLRIGLAVGSEGLIEGLVRIKSSMNSYTLDRLAIIGATEAFRDDQYFQINCKKIINTRDRISDELCRMGFEVIPSKANFIFVRHKTMKAIELLTKLRECSIYVRHFNRPRIDNFLRISIGSDSEMEQLLMAVREIANVV